MQQRQPHPPKLSPKQPETACCPRRRTLTRAALSSCSWELSASRDWLLAPGPPPYTAACRHQSGRPLGGAAGQYCCTSRAGGCANHHHLHGCQQQRPATRSRREGGVSSSSSSGGGGQQPAHPPAAAAQTRRRAPHHSAPSPAPGRCHRVTGTGLRRRRRAWPAAPCAMGRARERMQTGAGGAWPGQDGAAPCHPRLQAPSDRRTSAATLSKSELPKALMAAVRSLMGRGGVSPVPALWGWLGVPPMAAAVAAVVARGVLPPCLRGWPGAGLLIACASNKILGLGAGRHTRCSRLQPRRSPGRGQQRPAVPE